MKILFLISTMGPGGAERQASLICNHWGCSGRNVVLATLYDDPSHYELHPAISRRALRGGRPSALQKYWIDLPRIRRLVIEERPDVVVANIDATNIKALLSSFGLDLPVIVVEHMSPASLFQGYPPGQAAMVAMLRRLTYPVSSALVVQTRAGARWAQARRIARRIEVIPNITAVDLDDGQRESHSNRVILAVGRLTRQKGHDILIRAFARVADRFPDWRLKIIGDGILRSELSTLIESLGLRNRAELAPVRKNIGKGYRSADIFALPSRFEGHPVVLLEAMQAGCAVIAADCPTGPAEVITDGADGLLVRAEDVADLSSKLAALMMNPAQRMALGERAKETAKKYTPDAILPLWDRLIDSIVTAHRSRAVGARH